MGLDMYLNRYPKYFGNDYQKSKAVSYFLSWIKYEIDNGCRCSFEEWTGLNYKSLPDTTELIKAIEKFPINTAIEEVAYWRKANAIHKWFVDSVQDGIDDCREHRPITKNDLETLKDLCERVLNNHDLAPELLPAMSGFFFGKCDYDEYYFDIIEETIDICNKLIDTFDFDNYYLFYCSSW